MPYVNYNLTDLNNLAKYATGAAINHTDISFSDGVVGYGILAGGAKTIQGGKWLWKNRKDYKGAINTAKANFRKQAALERSLKGKNIFETTKNFAQYQKTTLEAVELLLYKFISLHDTTFFEKNQRFFRIRIKF